MSEEYIVRDIRRSYVYQPNHLLCWAACALTMYRYRSGSSGRGHDIDSFLRGMGNQYYFQCSDFASEVNALMVGESLSNADANARARRENPGRWAADVADGLYSGRAQDFFVTQMNLRYTLYGTASGQFNATDKAAAMQFIKDKAPLVVFTRDHLRIIVGYWHSSDTDANSPQIIVFDPEQAVNRSEAGNYDGDWDRMVAALREPRFLWPHFQSQFVQSMAPLVNGVFHY